MSRLARNPDRGCLKHSATLHSLRRGATSRAHFDEDSRWIGQDRLIDVRCRHVVAQNENGGEASMQGKTRSVGVKLTISFLVVALVVVGVAVYSYFALEQIDSGVNALYRNHLLPMHDLLEARASPQQIRGALAEYRDFPERRTVLRAEIDDAIAGANQALAAHAGTELLPEGAAALQGVTEAWQEYLVLVDAVLNTIDADETQSTSSMLKVAELTAAQKQVADAFTALVALDFAIS